MVQAFVEGVDLLVFPECALTGYPPYDIENSSSVDFDKVVSACETLQNLASNYAMYLIVGTITKEDDRYYNSTLLFSPSGEIGSYHKRALWGWDRDNFSIKNSSGVFDIHGWKVGVRICFEVRFPEFFRELYKENTELNILLFYDVSEQDSIGRYELIKSHIRTRAVENVTYTLSVDTITPYQTAPTALYSRSGRSLAELERNKEGLLVYDLEKTPLDFGENGRKEISDWLTAEFN